MPLVFTQKLEAGQYGDVIGKTYVFPSKWLNLIKMEEGDKFVYYRPFEKKDGRHYFGSGVIQKISKMKDEDLIVVQIANYKKYGSPVPHKLPSGDYVETGDESTPMFWWSIRKINDEDLARIESQANQATPNR